MSTIAVRLKEARGNRTRKEVCEIVGISLSALMMYENGERIPRDEIKVKLAKLYEKSIEDLFYPQK